MRNCEDAGVGSCGRAGGAQRQSAGAVAQRHRSAGWLLSGLAVVLTGLFFLKGWLRALCTTRSRRHIAVHDTQIALCSRGQPAVVDSCP